MNLDVTKNVSNLTPILCPDNSQTFFNTTFQESYHSKVGAILESEHKFITPCKDILKNSQNKKIRILDPFFGLGYNTGMALDLAYKSCKNPYIEIIAIEKDIEIIKEIKNIQVPENYKQWKNLLKSFPEKNYIEFENVKISLFIDDIFNSISSLQKHSFDIIFFDPFSYKVTPEFWDNDFLLTVFNLLLPGGKLTTYSGLKRVEKLAIDNRLNVIRIPALGKKTHSLCIENPIGSLPQKG